MTRRPHILIAGFGSIGRRHLGIVRELHPDARITVCRPFSAVDGAPVPDGADRLIGDLAATETDPPSHAVVAVAAPAHVAVARSLLGMGAHVLIEKPLADRPDGIGDLAAAADRAGRTVAVGYCLRFHPAVAALKAALVAGELGDVRYLRAEVGQYLPDWRPDADYRTGVTASAALGGGALLELSHEIDYVLWLLGRPKSVLATCRRVGGLDIDVEDLVEIVLDFDGCVAAIHLDLLQRTPVRTCKIVAERGTLDADLIANRLGRGGAGDPGWRDEPLPGTERNDIFRAQWRAFMDAADGGRPAGELLAGIADGAAVLDVVAAARLSAAEGRRVDLKDVSHAG